MASQRERVKLINTVTKKTNKKNVLNQKAFTVIVRDKNKNVSYKLVLRINTRYVLVNISQGESS